MSGAVSLSFDRGTLVVKGAARPEHAVWDARSGVFRAPAYLYPRVRAWAVASGGEVRDQVASGFSPLPARLAAADLRPYQSDAVRSFLTLGKRGVVVMPTGSGKTRVALSLLRELNVATVILAPTRALVAQWRQVLAESYQGPIGVGSDGELTVAPITVMTFESAYRHLDRVGYHFGLLIVDEVHHFGGGVRVEALECLPAPFRLGLTATAPPAESEAAAQLHKVIGPVLYQLQIASLVGEHLAPLSQVHLPVSLEPDERRAYVAGWSPFAEAHRAFRRTHRGADYREFLRMLGQSPEGRRLFWAAREAESIALFPRAKAQLVSMLLDRHGQETSLLFVGSTRDAYEIARRDLIPAISADTTTKERERVLAALRSGEVAAIVSAQVLNEGIDLPDAEVAVLVAGRLGGRELVQRVGRVLRPRPGKQATVYTMATLDTIDARRFERSWRDLGSH